MGMVVQINLNEQKQSYNQTSCCPLPIIPLFYYKLVKMKSFVFGAMLLVFLALFTLQGQCRINQDSDDSDNSEQFRSAVQDLKSEEDGCRRQCKETKISCENEATNGEERLQCRDDNRACKAQCKEIFRSEKSQVEQEIYGSDSNEETDDDDSTDDSEAFQSAVQSLKDEEDSCRSQCKQAKLDCALAARSTEERRQCDEENSACKEQCKQSFQSQKSQVEQEIYGSNDSDDSNDSDNSSDSDDSSEDTDDSSEDDDSTDASDGNDSTDESDESDESDDTSDNESSEETA